MQKMKKKQSESFGKSMFKTKLFVRQEKRWENNPIAQVLLYIPASIISSILVLPMILLSIPFLIFNKKTQKTVFSILLYLQHMMSLSFWYFIFDILFPNTTTISIWISYPLTLAFVYISFKKTIECMVNESLARAGF